MAVFWSDEYTGPRYTYYSPLRPIPAHLLPAGFTTVLTSGQAQDIIVTTKPLPESFVGQASLELMALEPGVARGPVA